MPTPVLTLRQLNRALLARQMLLERESCAALEAVERLAGLQAQIPNPPYLGLWTRLQNFQRADLTQLMEQRQIVRAALMRSTLHLVSAADHHRFRPVLQPALSRALNAFFGQRAKGLNLEQLVEVARPFLESEPRTTGELRRLLLTLEPERDGDALAYAVRNHLPLVQVPPGGTWGSGSRAGYVTAEAWLGPGRPGDLRSLLHRYLAAFGPASVMDFQAWAGMTQLKKAIEPLKAGLRCFRDEQGIELLDLPDAPLPPAETPAPVRLMPEYDNLIISHADRRRIIADQHRPKVFLSAARVRATFLIDGFVAGAWKIERTKTAARLTFEPFEPLSPETRDALIAEGERLLHFVEDSAALFEIEFL